jgi:hypothetical protein
MDIRHGLPPHLTFPRGTVAMIVGIAVRKLKADVDGVIDNTFPTYVFSGEV